MRLLPLLLVLCVMGCGNKEPVSKITFISKTENVIFAGYLIDGRKVTIFENEKGELSRVEILTDSSDQLHGDGYII